MEYKSKDDIQKPKRAMKNRNSVKKQPAKNAAQVSNPKNAAQVSNPKNAAQVSNPKNAAQLSNPKNAAQVSNPKNAAQVSNPKNAAQLSNPKDGVIKSNDRIINIPLILINGEDLNKVRRSNVIAGYKKLASLEKYWVDKYEELLQRFQELQNILDPIAMDFLNRDKLFQPFKISKNATIWSSLIFRIKQLNNAPQVRYNIYCSSAEFLEKNIFFVSDEYLTKHEQLIHLNKKNLEEGIFPRPNGEPIYYQSDLDIYNNVYELIHLALIIS